MRQLFFLGAGSLEWREAPDPVIETSLDAIVRPLSVATCDLDGAAIRGIAPLAGPYPFGHECVAEVIDVGDEVSAVVRGDIVICPFQVSCGSCARCERGLTGSCTTVKVGSAYGLGQLGGLEWGGTLADLVRVPFADAMLVRVEPGSEKLASLADNVPDGWRTVASPLEQRPGAPVLILAGGGAGSVPLYAAASAVALGSTQVDYVDHDPRRLQIAADVGANPVEIELGEYPRRMGAYPITVDSSVNTRGLACAILSAEPGGVCTSTGIYFQPTPLPLLEMYTRGVTFITSRVNARTAIEPILKLVSDGKLQPEKVTTETASWEDAIEALKSYTVKLVISRS